MNYDIWGCHNTDNGPKWIKYGFYEAYTRLVTWNTHLFTEGELTSMPTPRPLHEIFNDLEYHGINLYGGGAGLVFDEGQTAYVVHGWVTGPDPSPSGYDFPSWSEMTPAQQAEYLRTASFELSIDGEPVELKRFQWYDDSSDDMYVVYYAVFESGHFSPDTYDFNAVWYSEHTPIHGDTLEYPYPTIHEVTVTPTP